MFKVWVVFVFMSNYQVYFSLCASASLRETSYSFLCEQSPRGRGGSPKASINLSSVTFNLVAAPRISGRGGGSKGIPKAAFNYASVTPNFLAAVTKSMGGSGGLCCSCSGVGVTFSAICSG